MKELREHKKHIAVINCPEVEMNKLHMIFTTSLSCTCSEVPYEFLEFYLNQEKEKLAHFLQYFDFLLLDLREGDTKTLDMIKIICEVVKAPLFILSEHLDASMRELLFSAGIVDVFYKPVVTQEIVSKCSFYFNTSFSDKTTIFYDLHTNHLGTVFCQEEHIVLTERERILCFQFLQKPQQIFDRKTIASFLHLGILEENNRIIDNIVWSVRKKLSEVKSCCTIKSKRGKGYFLCKKEIES